VKNKKEKTLRFQGEARKIRVLVSFWGEVDDGANLVFILIPVTRLW